MPSREEVHYFGAGPAPMPTQVLQEASSALLNYQDLGYGLQEMSHRSAQATQVLTDTKSALTELLDIPDDYEILFMHGGGSGEFSAVVYHLVGVWVERQRKHFESELNGTTNGNAAHDNDNLSEFKAYINRALRLDYLVTGSWSLKASQEAAKLVGAEHVNVALDARKYNEGKFGTIPDESAWTLQKLEVDPRTNEAVRPALTYFCDNETVDGVEFPAFPKSFESTGDADDRMIVADMSSNFLSRKVDVRRYSVIFGGAQKNVGSTGITIVIIKKSLLPPNAQVASPVLMRQLGLPIGPIVLDFATIAKNNSLYNTLPIFDVWIAGRVMSRSVKMFGNEKVAGQEVIANEKANLLYGTIDKYPEIYQVVPDKAVRSRMNICMRVKKGDADAEKKFISGAEQRYLMGLKGHRSVGGIRISNYNAVTMDGVKKLVKYLDDFASDN